MLVRSENQGERYGFRLIVFIRSSAEGHMCPACVANAAVMVAGAGSTGGLVALCIRKIRRIFRTNHTGLFQKRKEKEDDNKQRER